MTTARIDRREAGTLDRDARRALVAGAAAIAIASAFLASGRGAGVALAPAALSLLVWLAVAWLFQRACAAAEAEGAAAPAALGVATHLTLLRALLISGLAGLLLVPPEGAVRWLPGPLYTAAALLDRYDGAVARRRGEVSALGARLDVAVDALGLLVAPLVGVVWGRLPPWYLLLGAAYYVFRAGVAVRRARGLPVFPERLRPNRHARLFAGIQMTVVAASLFPFIPWWLAAPAATAAMLPTLALFAREWLIVTGRLAPPDGDRGAASPGIAAR